jgi:hypothetical protein
MFGLEFGVLWEREVRGLGVGVEDFDGEQGGGWILGKRRY